jgi:hypothetical protein
VGCACGEGRQRQMEKRSMKMVGGAFVEEEVDVR